MIGTINLSLKDKTPIKSIEFAKRKICESLNMDKTFEGRYETMKKFISNNCYNNFIPTTTKFLSYDDINIIQWIHNNAQCFIVFNDVKEMIQKYRTEFNIEFDIHIMNDEGKMKTIFIIPNAPEYEKQIIDYEFTPQLLESFYEFLMGSITIAIYKGEYNDHYNSVVFEAQTILSNGYYIISFESLKFALEERLYKIFLGYLYSKFGTTLNMCMETTKDNNLITVFNVLFN